MSTALDDLLEAFSSGWKSAPVSSDVITKGKAPGTAYRTMLSRVYTIADRHMPVNGSRNGVSHGDRDGSPETSLEDKVVHISNSPHPFLMRLQFNQLAVAIVQERSQVPKISNPPGSALPNGSSQSDERSMDDIMRALIGASQASRAVGPVNDAGKTSAVYPTFQKTTSTQPRQEWKGFKSTSTVSKSPSSSQRPPSSSSTSPRQTLPVQSTAFNSTTIRAPAMEQSNSTSSDDSAKKYGQFVRKEDIRISYDYAVDYSRKDKDRALPAFRKREHKKVSIRGAAERQAARERGDAPSVDEQDKAEDGEFEYRPKPAEPKGWGTYRKDSSSEDGDRGGPAKDLKDEWSFDDIEEPAPPKSSKGPEPESSNGRVVGGGDYGRIEYDESAPGWVPNITRREDPDLSREEKSMLRYKEATVALEATPYVPDYIPANEYVAPHLKFSRELAFPEPPPPEHWAHEKEEDQSRQQQRVSLIDLDPGCS